MFSVVALLASGGIQHAIAAEGHGQLLTDGALVISGDLDATGAGEWWFGGPFQQVAEAESNGAEPTDADASGPGLSGTLHDAVVFEVRRESTSTDNPVGGQLFDLQPDPPTRTRTDIEIGALAIDSIADAGHVLVVVDEPEALWAHAADGEPWDLVAHQDAQLVKEHPDAQNADDLAFHYTYTADGIRFPVPATAGAVSGPATLMVRDAAFTITTDDGTDHRFVSQAESTTDATGVTTTVETWYEVRIGHADLAMGANPSGTTRAWLERPVLAVAGTIEAMALDGSLDIDGASFDVAGRRVEASGLLELRPTAGGAFQPEDGVSGSLSGDGPRSGTYSGTANRIDGDIQSLSLDARTVQIQGDDAWVAASTGVGIVALLGAFVVFSQHAKWALFGVFAPLYAKTEKSRLLENESRDRIYRAIRENPGVNLSKIHRIAELGWGVTVYHLKMLEKNGLVFSDTSNRDRCFFENVPRNRQMADAITAIANNGRMKALARLVVAQPGSNQRELVAAADVSQRAASYYLTKLSKEGLVEKRRVKNFTHYYPTPRLDSLLPLLDPASPEAQERSSVQHPAGAPAKTDPVAA